MGGLRIDKAPSVVVPDADDNEPQVRVERRGGKEYLYFPTTEIEGERDHLIAGGQLKSYVNGFWRRVADEGTLSRQRRGLRSISVQDIMTRAAESPQRPLELKVYLDGSGSMSGKRLFLLSQMGGLLRVAESLKIELRVSFAQFEGGKIYELMPMTRLDGDGIKKLSAVLLGEFDVIGGKETIYAAIEDGRIYFEGRADVTPAVMVLTDSEAERHEEEDGIAMANAETDGVETVVMRDIINDTAFGADGTKKNWLAITDDVSYFFKKLIDAGGAEAEGNLKYLASHSGEFLFRLAVLRAIQPDRTWIEAIKAVYYDPSWQGRMKECSRDRCYPSYTKWPGEYDEKWMWLILLHELGTQAAERELYELSLEAVRRNVLGADDDFFRFFKVDQFLFLDVLMSSPASDYPDMHFKYGLREAFKDPSPEVINEIVKMLDRMLSQKVETDWQYDSKYSRRDFPNAIWWLMSYFDFIPEVATAPVVVDRLKEYVESCDISNGVGPHWSELVDFLRKHSLLSADDARRLLKKAFQSSVPNWDKIVMFLSYLPEWEQNTTLLDCITFDSFYAESAYEHVSDMPEARKRPILEAALARNIKRGSVREYIRADGVIAGGDTLKMFDLFMEHRHAIGELDKQRSKLYERHILNTICERLVKAFVFGHDPEKDAVAIDKIADIFKKSGVVSCEGYENCEWHRKFVPENFERMLKDLSGDEEKARGLFIDVAWYYYNAHPVAFRKYALRELSLENFNGVRKQQLFLTVWNAGTKKSRSGCSVGRRVYTEENPRKNDYDDFIGGLLSDAEKAYKGELDIGETAWRYYRSETSCFISCRFMLDVVRDKNIPRDIRYKALTVLPGLDRWSNYRLVQGALEELAKDEGDPLKAVIAAKIEDIKMDQPDIIMGAEKNDR